MTDKLYLVTRRDLPPGSRATQMAHALREYVEHCPESDRAWYETSKTLVCLEVADEPSLRELIDKALVRDVPVAVFEEPDLGDALTAIALGPSAKPFVRHLDLALAS